MSISIPCVNLCHAMMQSKNEVLKINFKIKIFHFVLSNSWTPLNRLLRVIGQQQYYISREIASQPIKIPVSQKNIYNVYYQVLFYSVITMSYKVT